MDQGFFCRIRGVDGVPQHCEVAARSPPRAAGRTDARNGPACVGFIDRSERESHTRIECVFPLYIAMEKGERAAKADEIMRLAMHFSRTVHELVRPGEPVVALQPHLRGVAERMKAGDHRQLLEAIDELQCFAEDYRQLEELMNVPLRSSFPPELSLDTPIQVTELAEGVAVQERRRLGLGDQPVIHLRSILEWDVGLRIFYGEELPSAIAGMYAWTADLGCCILINRNHPPQRRRMSMVHEYGHLIVDRYKPGIDYVSMTGRKPANERFAETFGLSFLMPASSLRAKFHEVVTSTGDFKVADLCRLSHFYFVSVEAMPLRLEKLGLLPGGSFEILKDARFSPMKAGQVLEPQPQPETSKVKEDAQYILQHDSEHPGKLVKTPTCPAWPVARVRANARP